MPYFSDNGYTVDQSGNNLTITRDGGSPVTITVPGLSASGTLINGDNFHQYVRTHRVASDTETDDATVWENLREEPTPFGEGGDTPVSDSSTSNVPGLGTVTHYIDSGDYVVTNLANDGHFLYPGAVIRLLYQDGDAYYITTIGIGNGAAGLLNTLSSDWVWRGNASKIGRESVEESEFDRTPSSLFRPAPPNPMPPVRSVWGDAFDTASPLVLDLDGDGIELTEFDAATTITFFDIDADGFAEQTAWVDTDDGMLAIDLNENGKIDGAQELFGSATVDGFALLQTLDSNGDHVINQYDESWGDLVVWQDADGDAVTDSGELISLATLDIVSIDLASIVPSSSTESGNPISHTSHFTYTNGSTDVIADAWFVHDAMNTSFAGDYTLDARVMQLPSLRGFGEIADLHIAMSQDEDLLELVEDFALTWDYGRFAEGDVLNEDIEDILFRWAGVDGVSATSRGDWIDARKLEFMEKLFGEQFIQQGMYQNPYQQASQVLMDAWAMLFGNMRAQLLLQVGADSIFEGDVGYNVWSGEIDGDTALSSSAIDNLEVEASLGGVDEEAFWIAVAQFLDFAKGFENFSGTEDGWMDDAIYDTNPGLSWDGIKEYASEEVAGSTYNGTSSGETINGSIGDDIINGQAGADTLNGGDGRDVVGGGSGNDTINGGNNDDILYGDDDNDTLYGGEGADELYGNNGNDILDGGAGGDSAYGGSGNDTFVYTSGDDYYEGASGTDTITLPSGIIFGDLEIFRLLHQSGDYLNINVDTLGTIQTPFFNSIYGILAYEIIESITFHDTSTYTLSSFTELTTYGTAGDEEIYGMYTSVDIEDTIYGMGGNDILRGQGDDDKLDGGSGNDTLYGGAGDDTYYASAGFDVISEYSGTDTLIIPDGYDMGDVSFLRKNDAPNNLEITIAGLGQIRIIEQLGYSSSYYIEYLEFFGESPVAFTSLDIETVGTSGNDYITGIPGGASTNDIMDGRDGNDSLLGGVGNDTYYFSEGTDTIQEGSGTDKIAFRAGVLPEDISVYRGSGNYFTELVVEDQYGNKLKSMQHFTLSGGYDYSTYSIEQIIFADTTTWTLSGIEIETRGTGSADYIDGTTGGDASSADTIFGMGGNDTINGYAGNDWLDGGNGDDSLSGGADNDTYVFSAGLDYITESSGTDRLHIGGGVTISDISVVDVSTYNSKVVVNSSVNEVTIAMMRYFNPMYQVETISFDDGFSTTLPDYSSWTWGTSGNNTLTGTSGHDTIIGLAGDDTLSGAADNDNIHGGSGADTLNGGNGADLLHGGTGDDALYGNDGLDTLFGGAGADDFIFESASAFNNVDVIKDFSANDNDTIDISDVLDTYYTHGVDVLTDFVQITTNGANSELRVDTSGTGTFGSGTLIAVVEGVTGLTDEVALATAGRLIAA